MKRIGLALLALLLLLPLAAFADDYTLPEKKQGKEPYLCDGDDRTYVTITRPAYMSAGFPRRKSTAWNIWTKAARF